MKQRWRGAALGAAALLALGGGARGAVTMPSTFGDGLVLQTNNEYGTRGFLNGFASPGERVTISGSGSYEVTADADGAWSVMINPHGSSSAPSVTLTVQGESGPPAVAKGCMFGDVFVCGGGSGMLAPLSAAANASAEIATAADYPLMRLFVAAPAAAASPARNVSGRWVPLTPASVAQFSALCYLTARQIGVRGNEHPTEYDKRKRPMGLVLAAADGAPLASWAPATPGPTHFNGMIAPLKYLSIRAALFAHGASAGEVTHGDVAAYGGQLAAVVQGWRALMPIGDFGFNIVQLGQVPASSGLSAADADAVRLAQTNAQPQAPNGTCGVGVAVSYDLATNDASAIGDRLALATLHSTYAAQCGGDENRTDCDAGAGEVCWWGGPQPVSASHVAGETTVKLLPCSAVGLTAVGDHPAGFEVSFEGSATTLSGPEWTAIPPAGVRLERAAITLSVPGGKAPSAVRFVVPRGAGGALTNAAGIAIAPFELQLAPGSPLTQPDGGSSEASAASKAAPGAIPLSPPMGYNSWNYYHCNIDETEVLALADAFETLGLQAAGYEYINLDDCWQVARRSNGTIIENPAMFPSGMRAIADAVHARGLKFGLYTAHATHTCQRRPGACQHEAIDAQTYCDWNLDYLKIDGCGGCPVASNVSWSIFREHFDACTVKTGRYMVESVESCGSVEGCGQWIAGIANLWRTGGDIQANWHSILGNAQRNNAMSSIANTHPGHFNDADMLQVGNVGVSDLEGRSHFAIWCIMGAPLLIGTDVIHASNATLATLTATELIEVNQDHGLNGAVQGVMLDLPAPPDALEQDPEAATVSVVKECSGSNVQWEWLDGVDGAVQITHKASGLLLTDPQCARASWPAPGRGPELTLAPPDAFSCGGKNQLFTLQPNRTITSSVDGSCLNVVGGGGGGVNTAVQLFAFCDHEHTFGRDVWIVDKESGTIKSSYGCLSNESVPTPGPGPNHKGGGTMQTWAKNMSDGTVAVALINLQDAASSDLTLSFSSVGLSGSVHVRDGWLRRDIGSFTGQYIAKAVPPHGSAFLRLTPAKLRLKTTDGASSLPLCSPVYHDFNGHDLLPPNPPPTHTAELCCKKCKSNNKCVAFAWATSSGTCYLKSQGESHGIGGRVSAYVNASCGCSSPAPPPKCWDCAPGPGCCGGSPAPPPGPHPPRPPPPPPGVLGQYRCLRGGDDSSLPHCDTTKTPAERVESIVSNLTASEMVDIVLKKPVARLSIGAYAMWSTEALHGVRLWPERCPFPDKCTTIFPTASAASRAFNSSLWESIGRAMGTEGRVLWNLGIVNDLSLRGPQVNIQRDPRWGRNSNSPAEDPRLTGLFGKHLVSGTQSPAKGVNLINSQMKHWTAYGVESGRMGFNGNVSVHDMAETYMVPLQIMLEANVSSAMCAYDAINGTPSCANGWMSNTVLRKEWGFSGVIESDCGALSHIQDQHKYTSDGPHTAAASMNGTCDVECDSVYSKSLLAASTAGLVSTTQLAAAARRILAHRFSLGLFDDPRGTEYWQGKYNSSATVHSAEHAAIAREAAQQSVVVAQNNGAVLPFKATTSSFALIGPMANITDVFLGDYRPAACPGPAEPAPEGTACLPTLYELLVKRAPQAKVTMVDSCADGPKCDKASPVTSAVTAAMQAAEVIVLALGEKTTDNDHDGHNTGGEGNDRHSVGLPGSQALLVEAALATKKPVVALILSGGSVSVDALAGAQSTAVVYAGFGGETGQNAIVDVLFGDAHASGRLPFTVYPESWGNATEMNDMSYQAGQGRSYKYLLPSVKPLFEFASGLSWTNFSLAAADAAEPLKLGPSPVPACVSVTNTGTSASPVVITLFSSTTRAKLKEAPRLLPNRQLLAFAKEHTTPGQKQSICLEISDKDVAMVDDAGSHIAYAGSYELMFFDGATKSSRPAVVAATRTVATIPPVDNPQPPCCSGAETSCC